MEYADKFKSFVFSFPASKRKSPPHALLNSLSLRDKLIFHDKFNKLPKSQQEFVFKTLQTSDLPAQVSENCFIPSQIGFFLFLGICSKPNTEDERS